MGTFHVIKEGIVYELWPEPAGGFSIAVPALPGCFSFGETIEQALTMVQEAIELWVDFAREKGMAVPEPFDLQRAS